MPNVTNPRLSVVKCLATQEYRPDAKSPQSSRVVLTLSVDGEQRLVVGEAETGYKALHAAFAKALKTELGAVDCPASAAEDVFGAMLEKVFGHFNECLQNSHERPHHPSGRTAAGRKYRHDGARHDEYRSVGAAISQPA